MRLCAVRIAGCSTRGCCCCFPSLLKQGMKVPLSEEEGEVVVLVNLNLARIPLESSY
jgi:hypothetical protein